MFVEIFDLTFGGVGDRHVLQAYLAMEVGSKICIIQCADVKDIEVPC